MPWGLLLSKDLTLAAAVLLLANGQRACFLFYASVNSNLDFQETDHSCYLQVGLLALVKEHQFDLEEL